MGLKKPKMQVLLRGRQRVNGGWRAAVTRLETRLRESGSNIMNWTTFRNQYKPAQLSGQLYSFVIFSHPLRSVNGTKILALQTWTNHSLDWQVIFLRGQRWKEYSRYPNEPRKIRAKVLKKVYNVDSALKIDSLKLASDIANHRSKVYLVKMSSSFASV